jgi:diphthamide synthase subunit DPH2
MVNINRIREKRCRLYRDDQFIGIISSYLSLTDVFLQILQEKATGYNIRWKKYRFDILANGSCPQLPRDWYDPLKFARQIIELRKARNETALL